jgi:N6-L-threonylcarbamoyladenine synthase
MSRMILSIESSCDDSSIAVTEIATKTLHFHRKISQEQEHTLYGGVVPELASRLHAVALPKILEEARDYFPHLKAIAVTSEPGLSIALMEGIMMAKALSLGLHLPLVSVNHLKAHIYSLFIQKESLFPLTVLLVSGGHTLLLEAKTHLEMRLIGETGDDSFGESFDKVAKMLDLGYPGGPIVERMAHEGNPERFPFTVPLSHKKEIAFSFSGLKNAVRLAVLECGIVSDQDKKDICASFQRVVTEHLLQKVRCHFSQSPPQYFAIVGGASANMYVRSKMQALCDSFGTLLLLAPLSFCSDNAAMVGRCAIPDVLAQRYTPLDDLVAKPKSALFDV